MNKTSMARGRVVRLGNPPPEGRHEKATYGYQHENQRALDRAFFEDDGPRVLTRRMRRRRRRT